METSLKTKTKWSTRELKEDIIEVSDMTLENRERIKNVERCTEEFGKHLQRHGDLLDPKLDRLDKVMFGEKGDDGAIRELHRLCDMDERLIKIENTINKLAWMVAVAVIGAVLKLVIFP